MSSVELHDIIFEIVKGVILAFGGWLLKMHTDVKTLRREMDCAFKKIRELENKK